MRGSAQAEGGSARSGNPSRLHSGLAAVGARRAAQPLCGRDMCGHVNTPACSWHQVVPQLWSSPPWCSCWWAAPATLHAGAQVLGACAKQRLPPADVSVLGSGMMEWCRERDRLINVIGGMAADAGGSSETVGATPAHASVPRCLMQAPSSGA